MLRLLFLLLTVVVQVVRMALRSQADLVIENVALRQQVGVLKRRRPRPHLDDAEYGARLRLGWDAVS